MIKSSELIYIVMFAITFAVACSREFLQILILIFWFFKNHQNRPTFVKQEWHSSVYSGRLEYIYWNSLCHPGLLLGLLAFPVRICDMSHITTSSRHCDPSLLLWDSVFCSRVYMYCVYWMHYETLRDKWVGRFESWILRDILWNVFSRLKFTRESPHPTRSRTSSNTRKYSNRIKPLIARSTNGIVI